MKRKIEIPEMDEKDALRWYAKIRPIVRLNKKSYFVHKYEDKEPLNVSYIWANKKEDFDSKVDYSKLSVLADVKMLHAWNYYDVFMPTVGEIIKQIPKDLLSKTVAFEIVYSPNGNNDFSLFKAEFDEYYHVSVVRLYQLKDESLPSAKPVNSYPDDFSKLPIGMSEKEFQKLENLI